MTFFVAAGFLLHGDVNKKYLSVRKSGRLTYGARQSFCFAPHKNLCRIKLSEFQLKKYLNMYDCIVFSGGWCLGVARLPTVEGHHDIFPGCTSASNNWLLANFLLFKIQIFPRKFQLSGISQVPTKLQIYNSQFFSQKWFIALAASNGNCVKTFWVEFVSREVCERIYFALQQLNLKLQ